MILIAGAGAMADAAKAMRRIQRNLNRRIDKTKRRARSRGGASLVGDDYEPERTDFPCVHLCATCGFFLDEPAEGEDGKEPCPACGDIGWYELEIEPLAARVRDMEAEERMEPPGLAKALGLVGTVAISGLLLALAFLVPGWQLACGSVLAAVIAIPYAYNILPSKISVWLLKDRERLPHRWHMPLELPDPDETPTRRLPEVEARPLDGDTVEAPISGRECLAYQVCVLFDMPGDARPPEWALQEQRAVDVRLGDELEVSSQDLYLETPVEHVDAPGGSGESLLPDRDKTVGLYTDRQREKVKKFLRQRGLFMTEGEFHFYEACLQPGDRVDVADFDGRRYVVRHADVVESDQLPMLPQTS